MMTQSFKTKAIFVVGGPAGSGKTTVAVYLSQKLAVPYLEGDDVRLVFPNLANPELLLTRTVVSHRSKQT